MEREKKKSSLTDSSQGLWSTTSNTEALLGTNQHAASRGFQIRPQSDLEGAKELGDVESLIC